MMKFEWEWCNLCDAPFIRCPKCGNNSCNGTFGKVNDEACDVCNLCYMYQDMSTGCGMYPVKKDEVDMINKMINGDKIWWLEDEEEDKVYD